MLKLTFELFNVKHLRTLILRRRSKGNQWQKRREECCTAMNQFLERDFSSSKLQISSVDRSQDLHSESLNLFTRGQGLGTNNIIVSHTMKGTIREEESREGMHMQYVFS